MLADELRAAVERILTSGRYVLGPEVEAFENELAAYHEMPHAVGVASGTDAIELALRGSGIGHGDEVITVSHTAVATVCAIERAGATPVLVDIDPRTYTICADAAAAAITTRTKAILAVHLYGHPTDMARLRQITDRRALLLVEDCAQALGATLDGRHVGTFGHVAALSFYPTKNLGAFGDAGAVLTADAEIAARVRRLRVYGQASRGISVERGMNSRIDELQAALLRVKLRHLDHHNASRRALAIKYHEKLHDACPDLTLPIERADVHHAYHLYVVRHRQRDALRTSLAARGIETLVHYQAAVHEQPAYAHLRAGAGSLQETEHAAREVLSLPLYVGLDAGSIDHVARALADFLAGVTA